MTYSAKQEAQKQWTKNPCGLTKDISQTPKYSREFYEQINKNRYEEYAPWLKEIINNVDVKNKKLLEIGFGMGTDLHQFAQNGAEVYGIDLSPSHLEITQNRFKIYGNQANLQLHDATQIPFPDNHFDIVYSFGVIHHIDDTEKVVEEIHRVLKPGGKAIIGVYNFWSIFNLISLSKFPHSGCIKYYLSKKERANRLSTVEHRDKENNAKPLVKVYSRHQLKKLFKNFSMGKISTHHLQDHNFGALHHYSIIRRQLTPNRLKFLSKYFGWYHIIQSNK